MNEPSDITDLFESRIRPKKNPLSTYITVGTAARLAKVARDNGIATTDLVEKALSRLLDDMGVPQADIHGNLVEDRHCPSTGSDNT